MVCCMNPLDNYGFSLFGRMDIFTVLLILCIASPALSSRLDAGKSFNVVDFGAVGNGKTDDSHAFLKAWEAVCAASSNSPTLQIPSRKLFLLKPLDFQGPCKSNTIIVEISGNIVAPNGMSAWQGHPIETWISFNDVNRLVIKGSGQIDGQGSVWWGIKCGFDETNGKNCPRPTAIQFNKCNGLQLSGWKLINSPRNHMAINACNGVTISHLHIDSPPDSPNTDGINIGFSSHIQIRDCDIKSGDDCISILTGSSDINITHSGCGHGHGISIGSLGLNGAHDIVEDIHVNDVVFYETMNGVRIKTWQGGSGYARKISFNSITFKEVQNPIIIDQFYCPMGGCQNHTKAVEVSDVTYSGIQGTSSMETAINLSCSQNVACKNIVLNGINITSTDPKKKTNSYCWNAHGRSSDTIPAVPCLTK